MTKLNTLYQKNKELGIRVNKTFMVPVDQLYIEEGFNIRELNDEHIQSLKNGYDSGDLIPALVVETTEKGIKIVDGHHRYKAGKLAGIERFECKQFEGTEVDKIALMIKSSQGKPLQPVERASAYLRLKNRGLTEEEIGKAVGRSRVDVSNHLLLLSADSEVIDSVNNGEISFTNVVGEIRKSGTKANSKIKEAVQTAKSEGKKKAKVKRFNMKQANRAMYLLVNTGYGELETDSTEVAEILDMWLEDNQ